MNKISIHLVNMKRITMYTNIPIVHNIKIVNQCLKYIFSKMKLKELKDLPCLIILGIWLAKNFKIFENIYISSF